MSNYRSNLQAPDLRPYFKHIYERIEPNSQGHTVISDFRDKADDDPVFGVHKRCWFWTLDEAAILYNCARQFKNYDPLAVDIGGHTGWTSGYLCKAGCWGYSIDPMYTNDDFANRAIYNLLPMHRHLSLCPETSNEFFKSPLFSGLSCPIDVAVIDGNHSSPCPLEDAQNCAKHLKDRGIILLHDYRGEPIKEAYRWLLDNGFQGKTYRTPNGVAVCWRGEFTPPEHVHDPGIAEV